MKKFIGIFLKLLLKFAGIALGLFAITFAAYYFNLDMKLTSKMEPILFHFYDKVKRDQHL